ncbi:putative inactive serine/threonine-protein kinase scy1 [Nannochloris sp. 'desiccata']|nr:putative inactive serine/threonine-protein kinase scy1 [Chlorella desiccata (nom. nud.)]
MFAKLTSLVGGGVVLPFELGEPHSSAWGQWTHYRGTLTADDSPCSVFRISAVNKDEPRLRSARNGVKRLRTLRHPNILAFKDAVETEERGEHVVYLVTEAASPLVPTLRSLGLSGPQRDQYLAMGLHQVMSALSFVNNDCKLIHGNVCSASVVVTEGLDWRLHGFDLVTEHRDWPVGIGADIPLSAASWMVAAQYKPGEVGKQNWDAVRTSPEWSVDAWGLGCLIQEVYSGSSLARTEDLRVTDNIPKNLLPYYQKLLASTASRRLNVIKVLEAGVLKSKLGDMMVFIENLALKDSVERDSFFKKLPSMLPSVPVPVAQRKLLPLLAAALEFGGAPPMALGSLLAIGEGMSEEERSKQVLPILTKLFASNDRGIRRGLLENISSFGHALPAALVEGQIYPNVQTGFGDANPYLRELTLKSMVVLGPKLSQKTLNQSLLKHLAKLQVDEEPAIRANTTVLLGNLAPQLPDATCKKVLLNAFTRALKDPFPPARAAGLRAVMSTAKHHGAEDVAVRVVPMVGPLCVDPVQEVRSSALQCLEQFLGTLQKNSRDMEEKAAASATAGGNGAINSSGGGASTGGSLLTGFGWAVSSLVSKSGGATDVASVHQSQPARATSATGLGRSSTSGGGGGAGYTAPATSSQPSAPSISQKITQGWDDDDGNFGSVPSRTSSRAAEAAEEPISADVGGSGWGDDDDPLEDMVDAMAAEMEARKKLSKVTVISSKHATGAATRKPVVAGARGGGVAGARATVGGGGMKLGAKKLAKEEADEFAEW